MIPQLVSTFSTSCSASSYMLKLYIILDGDCTQFLIRHFKSVINAMNFKNWICSVS